MSVKKLKRKQKADKDLVILILLIPILLVAIIFIYSVANKIAKENRSVCKYLGGDWLEGISSPEDLNPRRGCFTYEELYE